MTDEELLIWLRVEDTNLTDLAAARIEELIKERDVLISQHAVMMMERDAAQFEIERLEAALLWCGGSADFNEGGVAREGWLKVCAPLLKGESQNGQ